MAPPLTSMPRQQPDRTAEDARRQASHQHGDFLVPDEEMALCDCHGLRWPVREITVEDGNRRHCPRTTAPQGGSIDRDILRQRDREEVLRRVADEIRPNRWPILALELLPVVGSVVPRPVNLKVGGPGVVVVVRGANLAAVDVLDLGDSVEAFLAPVWDADGLTCTFTASSPVGATPGDFPLTYAEAVIDNVFIVRR